MQLQDVSEESWQIILNAIQEHGIDAVLEDLAAVCATKVLCDECPSGDSCDRREIAEATYKERGQWQN